MPVCLRICLVKIHSFGISDKHHRWVWIPPNADCVSGCGWVWDAGFVLRRIAVNGTNEFVKWMHDYVGMCSVESEPYPWVRSRHRIQSFPLERGAGSTMTYRTITITTSSSIVKAPHQIDCSALNRFSLVRSVVWVLVIVQNVFRRNVARFNNTECKNWFHIQCVYVFQICYYAVQSLELWWTEDV